LEPILFYDTVLGMSKKRPVKLSITVLLSEELYSRLESVASREDRSMGAVVRRLLESMPEPEARHG
jgi:predicted DNA-binding protein